VIKMDVLIQYAKDADKRAANIVTDAVRQRGGTPYIIKEDSIERFQDRVDRAKYPIIVVVGGPRANPLYDIRTMYKVHPFKSPTREGRITWTQGVPGIFQTKKLGIDIGVAGYTREDTIRAAKRIRENGIVPYMPTHTHYPVDVSGITGDVKEKVADAMSRVLKVHPNVDHVYTYITPEREGKQYMNIYLRDNTYSIAQENVEAEIATITLVGIIILAITIVGGVTYFFGVKPVLMRALQGTAKSTVPPDAEKPYKSCLEKADTVKEKEECWKTYSTTKKFPGPKIAEMVSSMIPLAIIGIGGIMAIQLIGD